MALFVMILRKMIKNKWLELSLLSGLVLAVGLVSSIPIYSAATLQRMLVKELEQQQDKTGIYSGNHGVSVFMTSETPSSEKQKLLSKTDSFIKNKVHPGFGLPLKAYFIERATDQYSLVPQDPARVESSLQRLASITGISDMEQQFRLIDGKMPASEPVNGVYEAVVMESAMNALNVLIGYEFVIQDDAVKIPVRLKIVGIIDQKESGEVFWHSELTDYKKNIFIDFNLFERELTTGQKLNVRTSYWYSAFDYSKMKLEHIPSFIHTHALAESFFAESYSNHTVKTQALEVLNAYEKKEGRLRLMLWSLNVPVMIMLAFYLFMVSNLIMDRQKNEIAVLRSRGASRPQIMAAYLAEGLLLGAVAFAIGPVLGVQLTKLLGASSGFLEFVQRAAMDVELSAEAYRYGAAAMVCSLVMTVIPAFLATRETIVGHKQQLARQQTSSFWHKYGIDIVLVAVAGYGLVTFRRRMADMTSLGLESGDLKVDPLLFVVPALFILGTGLLILRIYPWLVQGIYWLGKRWWPPALYSTLIQVGRRATQYQFIMLFLVITLATGLFSASAARTINRNAAEKIDYANGADISMLLKWEDDGTTDNSEEAGDSSAAQANQAKQRVQYAEPPFLPLTQLPGVEHAAKVFSKNDVTLSVGKDRASAQLMGVDTDEFGRVAWLRDGLLDHHFYEYLNLIASDPSSVLISKSIADQFRIKQGDIIYMHWDDVQSTPFKVFGIIDYWPSWNPNPTKTAPAAPAGKQNLLGSKPMLVVGHLSYIQNNMALEPYQVWLKLQPNASSQELYDSLEAKGFQVIKLNDARQEMIRLKNDPFQLAINGVMTLGFIISIVISFFGFLLYWMLSLSGRILQFGILRAMGISFLQLIGMIAGEQVLTSGAAVIIGVVAGGLTSRLFVPLFQLSFDPSAQVPPFIVTIQASDQLHLYLVVAAMISIGMLIIGWMLSRIRIHQAIKLGED